jgi:hypothetical protein
MMVEPPETRQGKYEEEKKVVFGMRRFIGMERADAKIFLPIHGMSFLCLSRDI